MLGDQKAEPVGEIFAGKEMRSAGFRNLAFGLLEAQFVF